MLINIKQNRNGEFEMAKVLNRDVATSIVCPTVLMHNNIDLDLVAENRENKYYNVIGTNVVIAHIEDDFCILVDYMVRTYNSSNPVSLPNMLSASHYGVYQTENNLANRDWIKNTVTGRHIGYDIKEIIHGNGVKVAGSSLDHLVETLNELEKNKQFSTTNWNSGSHRFRLEIKSQDDLNDLILRIRKMDSQPGPCGLFM